MFLKFTNTKKSKNPKLPNSHPLSAFSYPYDDFKTSLLLTYLLLQVP